MDIRHLRPSNIKIGRIIDTDRQSRSFTTMTDSDPSTILRFNVLEDAKIFGLCGCPIHFSELHPGLRVRVRHASFMTMSIPPQTTAFVIQVIR